MTLPHYIKLSPRHLLTLPPPSTYYIYTDITHNKPNLSDGGKLHAKNENPPPHANNENHLNENPLHILANIAINENHPHHVTLRIF